MKTINWVLINGTFVALIYYGYVTGIEGAENLALFFAWVNIIFSFFLLHDEVINKLKEKRRSVPSWINVPFDVCIAAAFAWFGAWVTGAFWILQLVLLESAYQKIDHMRADNPNT